MADERGDEKTTRRLEPEIRIDDPDADRGFNSSDAFYSGDLFDRRDQEYSSDPEPDDDFELNRLSDVSAAAEAVEEDTSENEDDDIVEAWDDEPEDDAPIIPGRDEVHIPPAAPVAAATSQPKHSPPAGNLPLAAILAAAALLASLYAIWLGGGQADRIAQLENMERPKIEDMDKLQNQDINALANKLSAIEKEQQQLAAMKAELESLISKQSKKLQSDLADLESRMNKQDEGLKSELAKLAQKQSAKPVSAPVQPAPAVAKPKPAVKKPAADDSELPGPIESMPEARPATSPPAGGKSSWGVNLMSVESEAAANQEIKRLQDMGIQAEAIAITVGDRQMHRIRVAGFASKQEAVDMQSRLAREHGLKGWVNNQ